MCGGKLRIAEHRVRVQDIAVWYEQINLTTDAIVYHHPSSFLGDIYAALTYYSATHRLHGIGVAEPRAWGKPQLDPIPGQPMGIPPNEYAVEQGKQPLPLQRSGYSQRFFGFTGQLNRWIARYSQGIASALP
ncbi:DUF433 domain-containing protein [Nodosilinea sp. LEGE 06152]|uniref:DUF433 domain-containing protein n=1 Tax=Nodosilinea sp. LEGE 06152 TaxID=2777966 RepID=UPI003242FF01